MTNEKKDKITGIRSADVERWLLPEWDNQGNLITQNQTVAKDSKIEQPVAPEINYPTAAELEKIRSDAFQEGKIDGHTQGFEQGLEEGRLAGKQQGIDEGKVEGFEAGKQSGIEAGHTLAEQELDQLRLAFAELLLQLDKQVKVEQADWEKTLVAMICQLSQSLILTELEKRPEIIQAIVKKAVLALPEASQRIRIQVTPQHFEMVRDLADRSEGNWKIETNTNLSVGGCKVLSDQSLIDYSLEHRFRAQMAAVLEEAELNPDALIAQISEPLVQPELFQESESIDRIEPTLQPGRESTKDSLDSNSTEPNPDSDFDDAPLASEISESLNSDAITPEIESSHNAQWEENIEQPSDTTESNISRPDVAENSG